MPDRIEALAEAMRRRGWRLATAESCTGGSLAAACTAQAGASDWFEAGWVTYANAAKTALLGVPAALIDTHGAVSPEVACAMARGALERSSAHLALSITGIAGPGGGSAEKPVGTVWLGLALRTERKIEIEAQAKCLRLQGDRGAIRAASVEEALEWLRQAARSGER